MERMNLILENTGYQDAEQPAFFDFNLMSENLMPYCTISEFNEKETGKPANEAEEKLFGTHLAELKGALKEILSRK